jgi:Mlc titration factor MtfA (ptsG expression regulator)
MDSYGASDPAEFFAVATECFFEKPKQMCKRYPKLYGALRQFYTQDPAAWAADCASGANQTQEPTAAAIGSQKNSDVASGGGSGSA